VFTVDEHAGKNAIDAAHDASQNVPTYWLPFSKAAKNEVEVFATIFKDGQVPQFNGNRFYWNQNESLEELEQPDRIAEIKANFERTQERKRRSKKNKGLMSVLADFEGDDEPRVGCTICSL
jgi:hypothetical protein